MPQKGLLIRWGKHQDLCESLGEGVTIVSPDLRIVWSNQVAQEVFGDLEEVLGKPCYQVRGQNRVCLGCPALETFRMGEVIKKDGVCFTVKGQKRYFDLTTSPIKDETGNTVYVMELGRDVTHRRELEQKLKSSEEKYKCLYENAPIMYVTVDRLGIIVDCNQKVQELLGYSSKEMIGRPISSFLTASCAQEFIANFLQIQKAEVTSFVSKVRQLLGKDDTFIQAMDDLVPIRDHQGVIQGAYITFKEVTQLKTYHEQLERHNKQLRIKTLVAKEAYSSLEIDTVFQKVVHILCSQDNSEAVAIFLWSEAQQALVLKAHEGFDHTAFGEINEEYLRGLREKAFKDNEMIIERKGELRKKVIRSQLIIPLWLKEKTWGVMQIAFFKPHLFTSDQISFLKSIGNLLGMAIENAYIMQEALKGKAKLQKLSERYLRGLEQERRKIALDLHDVVDQILTAINFNLEEIKDKVPAQLTSSVEKIGKLVDRVSEEVHQLSSSLLPSLLHRLGLIPAVNKLVEDYKLQFLPKTELLVSGFDERVEPEIELVIYRIIQEALTNVAKHAQANKVTIFLKRRNSSILVNIEDDGRGFNYGKIMSLEDPQKALGLLGMQERICYVGGAVVHHIRHR